MADRMRVLRALALAVVVAWCSTAAAAEDAAIGQVVKMAGFVTLTRDDRTRVVAVGAAVSPADRIVTAADGRVELALRDRTVLVVGPASEIVVADYALDNAGGRLRGLLSLIGGILRATVTKGTDGGGFDVETRVAVASVRSTDWIVEADQPDHAAVFVVDGVVEVVSTTEKSSVRLEAGFGTDVVAGKAPTPPKQWGQKRVEAALARTRIP